MQAVEILSTALENGQFALSEFDSKKVLHSYGIPISREHLVRDVNEAIEAAALIGYPVVLKGCSPELIHKTEQDCIELNLKSEQDVKVAFERIVASADVELDGILVQEMVSGQRELILGLKRDPQFGAVVMVGVGGVFAEIVKDTAFRVAPIDVVEAEDMINQLKSRDILDSFRGGRRC